MGDPKEGLETVLHRLGSLERELASLRRQRVLFLWILGAGLLFLGAALHSTQPERISAKQVETQELVIRDEKGVLRAALMTAESFTAGPHILRPAKGPATYLALFDSSGAARITAGDTLTIYASSESE